jgi:hypothetical protein
MRPTRSCRSLGLLWIVSLTALLGTTVQTSGRDTTLAQSVLEKMHIARQSVGNFRCTVVYHDFRPNVVEQFNRDLDKLGQDMKRKALQAGLLPTKHTLQEHKVAFDNEGRARVEVSTGTANPDGSLAAPQNRLISTWDGKSSIDYEKRADRKYGSALLGKEPRSLTGKRHRQPWSQFGGTFVEFYKRALEQGAKIDINMQGDATYRVVIMYDDDSSRIGIVDPSQGYSVRVHEKYRNGRLIERCAATFNEVSPGIWFPVSGESLLFNVDNPSQVRTQTTVKISDIAINDPNFYDGLYRVDFPKGTIVTDLASGFQYTVGEPMSERFHGIFDVVSTGGIALETLEEIAREIAKEIQLFIPEASSAVEETAPFVADLSGRTLVYSNSKPDTEEGLKSLMELGAGDLAWDGRLIATRGAKVLTPKQESDRPMKHTQGQWAQVSDLPKDVKLPYWMVVVTKENAYYLLSVRRIEEDGIRVAYRKLASDEIGFHVQPPPEASQEP